MSEYDDITIMPMNKDYLNYINKSKNKEESK